MADGKRSPPGVKKAFAEDKEDNSALEVSTGVKKASFADDKEDKSALEVSTDVVAAKKPTGVKKARFADDKEDNSALEVSTDVFNAKKEAIVGEADDDDMPEELTNFQAISARHEEEARIAMSFPVNPHLCPDLNNRQNWSADDFVMYANWFCFESGYRGMKTHEEDIYTSWSLKNPKAAKKYFK